MIFELSTYLIMFVISSIMALVLQKTYHNVRLNGIKCVDKSLDIIFYCITACIFMLPIIAMSGLRYGIGSDYFNYLRFYNVLHGADIREYLIGHINDIDEFYVEPAYYVLNKITPSYRVLLWVLGILQFSIVFIALKSYLNEFCYPFALYIYLCTQYIYSLNGFRFAIALCIILIGYVNLSRNRTKKYIFLLLIAAIFHKTSLICLGMYFLKQFKHKKLNCFKNIAMYVFIITFPLISELIIRMGGMIPVFERYYSHSVYAISESMSLGWLWILHIVPVVLPLLLLCREDIFHTEDTSILFRICIMEIPFRVLGFYNNNFTRMVRFSQIVQVILIPLVITRQKSRQKRVLLYAYYIAWYTFYFGYYAIVNDAGASLPYVWIYS